MKSSLPGICLALWMLAGPASAQDVAARNAAIVAATEGADQVFVVLDGGDLRHQQSGMKCAAEFPEYRLARIFLFAPGGQDVGCVYERRNQAGQVVAKLTVYATKVKGETVDEVFARTKREIESSHAGFGYKGPALTFGTPSPVTDGIKSAEYDRRGEVSQRTDVILSLRDGWVIKVRGTFPTTISEPQDAVGSQTTVFAYFVAALNIAPKFNAPKP